MRGRTTLSENDWKTIVKAMGVYDGKGGKQLDEWKDKINALRRHQAVFIDAERYGGPDDCPVVESLAPLSAHPG
jgi:hypothetical protein